MNMSNVMLILALFAGLGLGGVGGYFSAKSGIITMLMNDIALIKTDVAGLKVQAPVVKVTPIVPTQTPAS